MKIIIRNLSRETTEEELLELFKPFGMVQSCDLVMDAVTGKSKGFGFANLPRAHEAKAAIKALNGTNVGGSTIRVKKAEDKKAEDKKVKNDD